VRHATNDDLAGLSVVLAELRCVDDLVERRPGVFYRRGRAFCHFHADESGLFADVRLDDEFERMRVTTVREQRALVSVLRVRATATA
jgi:hypothetical protein